jgi:rare lipoprotein A
VRTRALDRLALACALIGLAACGRDVQTPQARPHYVLGQPYQASGIWQYPRESFDLSETGLAAILPTPHPPLTSNGEVFDDKAAAASHATLQLPAIARITNLETGKSAVVRINDRGSGTPHRLVELTPAAAALLGVPPGGVVQIRLTVLPAESHAILETTENAPKLALQPAPRDAVEVAELPAPPGVRISDRRGYDAGTARPSPPVTPAVLLVPGAVTQVSPSPGRLWVRLGTFQTYEYAAHQRARVAALKPSIAAVAQGRSRLFRVMIGPLASVAQADQVLDQALAAGVTDARIVVE